MQYCSPWNAIFRFVIRQKIIDVEMPLCVFLVKNAPVVRFLLGKNAFVR